MEKSKHITFALTMLMQVILGLGCIFNLVAVSVCVGLILIDVVWLVTSTYIKDINNGEFDE